MKKIFVVSLIMVLSSCDTALKEQRFVNPLFYETLHPISRMTWETHLTPTKITLTNAGYTEVLNCELVENTASSISLECDFPDEQGRWLHKFTFLPPNEEDTRIYGGPLIKEETTNVDGSSHATSTFVIKNRSL